MPDMYHMYDMCHLQTYLMLLHFTFLSFANIKFFQTEGLWQPFEQIYQYHFFQHILTSCLCHILGILTVFQAFSLLLYLL